MPASRQDTSALAVAAVLAAYGVGVALQVQQAALWSVLAYAVMAASALLLLGLRRRLQYGRAVLACVCAAALGFGATGLHAALRLADALAPALEGQNLVLTGTVAQLPQPRADGVRFVFDVEAAMGQGRALRVGAEVPTRVHLSWPSGWHDEALIAGPPPALSAGQRWQLPVRLKAPHGVLNPHGFDAELWMFEQRWRATGSVRASATPPPRLLVEEAGAPIERLRQRVRDAILLHGLDDRAAGVLAALAIGDQQAIDSSGWDLFRDTGVAHLMSISGLHITMFAWLAALLVRRLWVHSRRLTHRVPAPVAARWAGVAAAAAYALLAGWGVPAQRTVLMLAAVAALHTIGVRWPALLVCMAAGVVVLAVDPWALLQPGFWLSFAAVALLIAADPARTATHGRNALRAALHTQWVASVGLAPLSLILFQQISLVGLLANLIAVPVVTLLVTPLALAGMLWPALWSAASGVLAPLLALLEAAAALPWATWQAAAPPWWLAAAGLAGGALLVLPLPWRLRFLGLPLLAMLCWPPPHRVPPGRFELLAADVGQGSAVLIRTHGHLLLHDAGPAYTSDSDAGRRVLVPLLLALGEPRIDRLVLSHRDSDHVGGAASLLARIAVGELSSSLEPGHPLLTRGLPQLRCAAGQQWQWDGVRFRILHPMPGPPAATANAQSCVLQVTDAEGRSALLTGDIGAAEESALVERLGPALRSEVLIVPHHGSKTSSTVGFIAAVQPRTAVVQAGYLNRYGHPAAEVIERYRAAGAELVRSDRCGAWRWNGAASACTRDERRRYWHAIPP